MASALENNEGQAEEMETSVCPHREALRIFKQQSAY